MSKLPEGLKPEPLSQKAFEPYGDVIDLSKLGSVNSNLDADADADLDPDIDIDTDSSRGFISVNNGTSTKFPDLALVELKGGDGSISVFRAQPRHLPMELEVLERHPLSSQAFLPLEATRFAVVVAGSAETPAPSGLRLFIAEQQQGINFRVGVWHHPLLALDHACDFLVVDRRDQSNNLEEFNVRDWRVTLAL